MSAYSEKLKDPRWQKKRLEVFQRDGFRSDPSIPPSGEAPLPPVIHTPGSLAVE